MDGVEQAFELILPAIDSVRVMVAGELVVDRYTSGVVARISPEAPIPVLKLTDRTARLGNAGFVAANLRAMGAAVTILSVVGEDSSGQFLRNMLTDCGALGILTDPSRPTIVKERFLGSVQAAKRAMQQLLRVDQEAAHPLSRTLEDALIARALDEITAVDAVLVCDINKGILTPRVLRALVDAARSQGIPILIDPRLDRDFSIYTGATAITPNRYETELATGMTLSDFEVWERAGDLLVRQLELDACLITLDRDGMYLTERVDRHTLIRTAPVAVSDVTGAGDVVLSTFGYFAAAGYSFPAAAQLANLAAGIEVSRLGADVISREDLSRAFCGRKEAVERESPVDVANDRTADEHVLKP